MPIPLRFYQKEHGRGCCSYFGPKVQLHSSTISFAVLLQYYINSIPFILFTHLPFERRRRRREGRARRSRKDAWFRTIFFSYSFAGVLLKDSGEFTGAGEKVLEAGESSLGLWRGRTEEEEDGAVSMPLHMLRKRGKWIGRKKREAAHLADELKGWWSNSSWAKRCFVASKT